MPAGQVTPTTPIYGCKIVVVDPTQGMIQGIMKGDNQVRGISVYTTPIAFRWPVPGEAWLVKQINGTWYLDSPWPDPDATTNHGAVAPGDVILNSPTGVVHVIGSNASPSLDYSITPALITGIGALAGEATVLTTLAGEATALTTLAGEATALTTLAGEATALGTLAGEATTLGTLAGEATALGTLAGEVTALSTLAGEATALGALVAETTTPVAWAGVPYTGSWGDAGGTFAVAQYSSNLLGECLLRGCVKSTTAWALNQTIGTLPVGFRPLGNEIFACAGSDATAGPITVFVKVLTSGVVGVYETAPVVASPAAMSLLSLSGISFATS